MINPLANKHFGLITADSDKTIKALSFSFEYSPCESHSWKTKWRRSKKRFPSMDEAVHAAGQWMQVCYENDWPIAVRLVEV